MGWFSTRQPKSIDKFEGLSTKLPINDEYFQSFMKVQLGHLIQSILMPYKIHDKFFGGINVYPYEQKGLYENSVNIYDILVNYFLGIDQYISKVNLPINNEKESVIISVSIEPKKDLLGKLYVPIRHGLFSTNLKVIKAIKVKGFASGAMVDQLRYVVGIYKAIYDTIGRAINASALPIFKKKGLSDIYQSFGQPGEIEEIDAFLRRQAIDIFQNGGIVDSLDELVFLPSIAQPINDWLDFANSQFARIIDLPQSKIFGTAPKGMNATGEYDDKQATYKLNTIRSNVVDTTLDGLEYKFDLIDIVSSDDIETLAGALMMLGNVDDNLLSFDEKLALKAEIVHSKKVKK